ncbi:C3a anaphylatoxin chemotactic receptor-like [Centroberyx affinis]|uniref:C3a anaphylatoxin chemotactic receptor-like n=1 Tax=Centroberyx affinis TaxID=166261 RepID=UPI003A5BE182
MNINNLFMNFSLTAGDSDLFNISYHTDRYQNTFVVSHPSRLPFLILACFVFGACCLLGIPANIVVIARLSCRLRHCTMTEHLFFNLAVSDLLSLLSIPAVAILIIAPYQFYFFFFFFCFSSGFFIVVLISVQRYYQVLHPQKWARLGQRGQWVLLLGIWVLAALLSLPAVFLPRGESDVGINPSGLHILLVLTVVCISLPVFSYLVMITFYIRLVRGVNRRKFFNDSHSRMTKLIIRIIASSLAFSIPPFTLQMLRLAAILTDSDTLLLFSDKLSFVSGFYLFKSCLNPFLYFFASRDRSGCDTKRPMEESPHDEDTV